MSISQNGASGGRLRILNQLTEPFELVLPADLREKVDWLYTHPRVKLSPHLSWSWPGAAATLADKFVENLRLRLSGRPLLNVIDPERGY